MTARQFLQITDLLSDAFFLLSTSGSILAANRAAHDLFRSGPLQQREFAAVLGDRPESITRALQLWSSSRQLMPAVFAAPNNSGGDAVRCDGGVVQAGTAASPPLLLVRCTPRSDTTATRPVTKLNGEIETLRTHLAELKTNEDEKIAALGSAAAVFAHEVANPLNAISTSLQIVEQELIEENSGSEVLREMVASATVEIDRLTSLLSDFRSFARPHFVDFRSANLLDIVTAAVMPLLSALRGKSIEVKFDFQPLPVLQVDPDKIKQAVLNLCNNAMDAMPTGGCLTLKSYVRQAPNVVVLEITDTGTGIAPGIDVFQLFLTTKPRGTGLGLPIVAQIIHAHGGRIDFRSAPGKGTTFVVLLPVAQADPDNSH